jgi:hypothetical protein
MPHDLLIALAGGGICTALLKFIEFLLARKFQTQDKKDSYATKEELKQGLQEREATGAERFNIHATAIGENTDSIRELTSVSKELINNVFLLTNNFSEMQQYDKIVGSAINGIIHDRITHNVDTYIDRGGITIEELSTLKSMYYPYKKLGGNGDVETAFEQANKLPVITKEEANNKDISLKKKKYNL